MPELNKQDLESLLRPHFGKDLVVESFTSKSLTKPGENYGSTMLAIDVNILQGKENTSSRKLSLVAKLVPPNEFLWKLFDSPNTFCKEITCYTLVREEYDKLQQEKHVPKEKFLDIFPKCYGARTSLAPEIGNKADKNAAIILENLKVKNYRVGDQKVGFDLKHTQLFVAKLARFHALAVALKLLKPQVFKDTVLKACKPHDRNFNKEEMKANTLKLLELAREIPDCEIYLDKIRKASELSNEILLDSSLLPPKEPYATIQHTDLWVNNMMFRYASPNDNIPLDVKFLDFQGVEYTSPVKDLLFFLYTSTAEGVRANNYDDLIRLYYDNFTDCLKDVGCETSPFTFQSFLDEIEAFAPTEFTRILFMLTPICGDQTEVPELADVNLDSLYRKPNDVYKQKGREFITDFVKRGWL